MSVNLNYEILSKFSGQESILSIPKLYVLFTGCHSKALVLNQIIFYSNKSKLSGGWFYKSYKEWQEDVCLSERGIRKILNHFHDQGIIEIKTNKIYGKRVLHIKIDIPKFMHLIGQYLTQPEQSAGVQDLPQPAQSAVSQPAQSAVSIYTDNSTDNSSYEEKFSHPKTQDAISIVELVEIFKEEFPGHPVPVQRKATKAFSKSFMDKVKETKEEYLAETKAELTKAIFRDYLMAFKVNAPGFCELKNKVTGNPIGLSSFIGWETFQNLINKRYF